MKRVIVLLFIMARLSALNEPNFAIAELSSENRERQLLNDQKYATADTILGSIFLNDRTSDGQKMARAKRGLEMFQEILGSASRDPQSVARGTLLDTKLKIAALYIEGIGVQKDWAKAEELLLPFAQASPPAVPLDIIIKSCYLIGATKIENGDLMAEQFFRKILMYDARYPKVSKEHEDVRYYTERSRLGIAAIQAHRGNLREATAYFRAAEKNIRRNPILNPAMSSHVKTNLDITRKLVTQALQRGMSAHAAENPNN